MPDEPTTGANSDTHDLVLHLEVGETGLRASLAGAEVPPWTPEIPDDLELAEIDELRKLWTSALVRTVRAAT